MTRGIFSKVLYPRHNKGLTGFIENEALGSADGITLRVGFQVILCFILTLKGFV
jgi:hypothetical protein